MSRFGDDIRRISKYQELLALILANSGDKINPAVKGALEGARGIAFASPIGYSSDTQGGTPGKTKPTKPKTDPKEEKPKPPGVDEAADEAKVSAGGSSLEGDNNDKQGWYDLESLLQGAKDGAGKAPPQGEDIINTITGALNGARAIVVHLRDANSAFQGDPNTPEGQDASTRIPDPEYVAGYYYISSGAGPGGTSSYTQPTPTQIQQDIVASWATYLTPDRQPASFVGWSPQPAAPSTNGVAIINDPTGNYNIPVNVVSCATTPNAYACPIIAPSVAWADLGATQLAWVTAVSEQASPLWQGLAGKFAAHPFDSSVPEEYENGASILDLTSNIGNTVRLGPLAAGGWYLYYRDPGTGLPVGLGTDNSVYTINPDRTPGGYITPNELAKKLPI